MGSTYSQHLSNDVGLFVVSGIIIIMLGSLWVFNMRDVFYTWKCHQNPDQPTDKQPCSNMSNILQFTALSVVVSVFLYAIVLLYSRYLAKYYPIPKT